MEQKDVRFTIMMNAQLRDELKHQSIIEHRSMSQIISNLVKEYLQNKGEN